MSWDKEKVKSYLASTTRLQLLIRKTLHINNNQLVPATAIKLRIWDPSDWLGVTLMCY